MRWVQQALATGVGVSGFLSSRYMSPMCIGGWDVTTRGGPLLGGMPLPLERSEARKHLCMSATNVRGFGAEWRGCAGANA